MPTWQLFYNTQLFIKYIKYACCRVNLLHSEDNIIVSHNIVLCHSSTKLKRYKYFLMNLIINEIKQTFILRVIIMFEF